jgi:hypothetical protein
MKADMRRTGLTSLMGIALFDITAMTNCKKAAAYCEQGILSRSFSII